MHVDYAIECYKKAKFPKYVEPKSDSYIIEMLATDELVDLAHSLAETKITSICETMRNSRGYKNVSGHKKITKLQQQAISKFILEKFATAEKVICAAFAITENEFSKRFDEV